VADVSDSEPSSSTRQRLLEAAFEVFAEKGYAGTRVQEIAKRAGFTTGAIYANFNGKAALLGEAIGSQGVSALAASTREVMAKDPAGRVLHRLGIDVILNERRPVDTLLLDALAAAARDPEVAALVRPRIDAWHNALHRLLAQSRERGEIDEAYSTEALAALCSVVALGGFVLRALDLPRPDAEELEAVMRQLVMAFAASKPPREGA
jgi:AcrR family transcriptional regulator